MGEIEKKRFKEPSDYYRSFFYHSLIVIIVLGALCGACFYSDEMIYDYIYKDSTGNSEDRLGKLLLRILVIYFGRTGFIIGLSLCFITVIYEFYKDVAAYSRYKRKCKLYHEGLIENFYDIYDDYVPLLSWQRIKMLFTRKGKEKKKKYPSKRKMKKQIKDWENYWKKL